MPGTITSDELDMPAVGDPSFREMERRCGRLRSHSTLYRVLTGDRMPTQVEVKAVILGCGGTVVNFAKAKKAS